ncbi:mitotic checkpoint protein BUB3.1 isoform X2 [Cryptomeria japonica]|uniref:mitotic checkpoint protein BUB3.1 isoform X2 n=1 Tax=Cryptomeria japonica TaxID=3369 RepID=UPI0025AD4880|nr:mitotic checkpoint protein BUB3.1 isoform X2 [Cryptomeria japonica]
MEEVEQDREGTGGQGSGDGGGQGRKLESPPKGVVSRVRFSPHSNTLLVSSWDPGFSTHSNIHLVSSLGSTVNLYNVDENALRTKFHHRAQALDCCFIDDSSALSAGSDGTLTRYNFITGTEEILGKHDSVVSCVEFSQSTGHIMTGSWDKTLRLWDSRANGGVSSNKHVQPGAVECMSLFGYYLVVASGMVAINIYDLRNMSGPMQEKESPLKYNTNCVCCYQDEAGYAIGSVEGRIALEFIDSSEAAEANTYAFRCHPKSNRARYYYVAVNAIEFHPIDGRFMTGNNEGYCILWDRNRKKRLYEERDNPNIYRECS